MNTDDTAEFHPHIDATSHDIPTEVLEDIETERLYQRHKWTEADERNNVGDFLLYMHRELHKGMQPETGYVAPGVGHDAAMAQIRKVVALGVAAMERWGGGDMTGRPVS